MKEYKLTEASTTKLEWDEGSNKDWVEPCTPDVEVPDDDGRGEWELISSCVHGTRIFWTWSRKVKKARE